MMRMKHKYNHWVTSEGNLAEQGKKGGAVVLEQSSTMSVKCVDRRATVSDTLLRKTDKIGGCTERPKKRRS